jgi:hypothetical protein
MLKIKPKKWLFLAAGLLIIALAGCQATPDEKQLDEWKNLEGPGEMKPGPGLFSGQDGKFTLYDSKKGGLFPKEGEAEASKTPSEKTAETSEAAGAAAAAAGSQAAAEASKTSEKAREFQEFQEFQQWQKEKERFHEYQQWKKSTAGSAEFKEFQEYRQWQKSAKDSSDFKEFQEYQQWKKCISSGKSPAGVRLIIRNFWNGRNLRPIRNGRRARNNDSSCNCRTLTSGWR